MFEIGWFAIVLAIGLAVGSFLNVVIYRVPLGKSVVSPPSSCPGCGHQLNAQENIPLLSWLALKGKCSQCKTPISRQYPAVELATGLLFLASFAVFTDAAIAVRVALFAAWLLAVAAIDWQHFTVPDAMTIPALAWVLLTGMVSTHNPPFSEAGNALLGACVGAGVITILSWLGQAALKKEAMGFGDATLMAVIGAAVGPYRVLLVIFVGATLALITLVAVMIPLAKRGKLLFNPPEDLLESLGQGRGRAEEAVIEAAGMATGASSEEAVADEAIAGETGEEAAGPGEEKSDAPGVFHLPLPFGVFLAPAAIITLYFGNAIIQIIFGK